MPTRTTPTVRCVHCRNIVLEAHARKIDEKSDGSEMWLCIRCDEPDMDPRHNDI